jgi:hypothetical protein
VVRAGDLAQLVVACGFGNRAVVVDEMVARTAAEHRLVPLLGKQVFAGTLTAAGDALADSLVAAYRRCAIVNAGVDMAMTPLLDALMRRGVPAMLLKGAALIRMVWDDPGARETSDVDVLVPADRWRDALAAVTDSGGTTIGAPRRALTLSLYHEVHVALHFGGIADIHRRLHAWPLFRVDEAAMLTRGRAAGDGWLLPDAVDLFVSLATHAAQDGFVVPLRYVVDALALVARLDVAPGAVAERAEAWRARTATALWLRVLGRFGLDGAGWREAIARLDPGGRTAARAAAFPYAAPASAAAGRRRMRISLLRSLDGVARPAAFVLARGAMYAGDLVWRLAPAPRGDKVREAG